MTTARRALLALLVAAVAATTLTAFTATSAVTAAPTATVAADDGAVITSQTRVDDRTVDLMITSPALGADAPVRLFLPAGYDDEPERTWPQLWLLHGCCEVVDYQSWDVKTDVKAFMSDKPVITVMPSDGVAGFYTKWWNYGLGGPPDWERFHTTELRQILDRNFRGDGRRAVAGLSIGGYGAIEYAASHKDMFSAAASYSGLPSTQLSFIPQVIKFILLRTGTFDVLRIWGSQVLQANIWAANNPYNKVEDLRGIRLYFSAGDGNTGPFEEPGEVDRNIEPFALASQRDFTNQLTRKGVPFVADYYGAGTHKWPYWERALKRSWSSTLAPGLGLAP